MVVEIPSEGVLYHDSVQAYTVCFPSPILECGSTQSGQIVLQMRVSLENRPKNVWHRKDDANPRYIRKRGPLLSLPEHGPPTPAARAAFSFACVVEDLSCHRRRILLAAEHTSSAVQHIMKVLPHEVGHAGWSQCGWVNSRIFFNGFLIGVIDWVLLVFEVV